MSFTVILSHPEQSSFLLDRVDDGGVFFPFLLTFYRPYRSIIPRNGAVLQGRGYGLFNKNFPYQQKLWSQGISRL